MKKTKTVPATKARIHLGEILRNVEREDVIIERDGYPVAVITDFAGYRSRFIADDGGRQARIDAATARYPTPAEVSAGLKAWTRPGPLTASQVRQMKRRVRDGRDLKSDRPGE